jgi:membrane-associated phospholipid phosphatase
VVLAVSVWAGWLGRVDQFAVDQLMPARRADAGVLPSGWALLPTLHIRSRGPHSTLGLIAEATTLVGSSLLACLVVVLLSVLLWRRGERTAAAIWSVAFLLGNAIEILGKTFVERSSLHRLVGDRLFILHAYDSSFPSGHMLRVSLLALMLSSVYARGRTVAALFSLLVGAMLVVSGAHVLSDVFGGALGAVLAAAVVRDAQTRLQLTAPSVVYRSRPEKGSRSGGDASNPRGS